MNDQYEWMKFRASISFSTRYQARRYSYRSRKASGTSQFAPRIICTSSTFRVNAQMRCESSCHCNEALYKARTTIDAHCLRLLRQNLGTQAYGLAYRNHPIDAVETSTTIIAPGGFPGWRH